MARHIRRNLTAIFSDQFGIGLKFNRFTTTEKSNTDQGWISSKMESKISINYFGIGMYFYQPVKNTSNFYHALVSVGYSRYLESNEGDIYLHNYYFSDHTHIKSELEGGAVSLYLANGVDLLLGENVSVGIQLGLTYVCYNKLTGNGKTYKLDEKLHLMGADLTAGLKIYF